MELPKGSRRIFKQQQQTKLYSHTLNLNTIANCHHIIEKKEQFCQDQYLFYPFIRKKRCPTYICIPLYPTPQYDNNKAHFFFLGTTFDFPFLSSFGFWRCNNKKQSNKYTITVLLIILTIP